MKTFAIFCALLLLTACDKTITEVSTVKNELRISSEADPQSLDPRLARTLIDTTVMHMLYEGVMRVDNQGQLQNALAQDITVSEDLKTYTITLKRTFWSDGSPLTAEDFIETWKSILDPKFPSPNAAQFYMIKGAKEAKAGSLSLKGVGLELISELAFKVELEYPTAYFKELLASHFFLPLNKKTRLQDPTNATLASFIFNGPFILNEWKLHNELTFNKNKDYWDKNNVNLDRIKFVISDTQTALSLYNNDSLDWAGSPMSTLPQDAISSLKKDGSLQVVNADGTYWFRFNTKAYPFNNLNFRKAFNLAINRDEIVKHITQGNQVVALGVLPPSLAFNKNGYFKDNQLTEAWTLFQESLKDLNISKDELPPIVICYGSNERNHKIAQAVQQQWIKAFSIPISLQSCEAKLAFEKFKKGKYQIMLGNWFADFSDPINFLDVFKTHQMTEGQSHWTFRYNQLIAESNMFDNEKERNEILQQADRLLMENVPVAPLFYNVFNFIKKDYVAGVYVSELGYLDFKNALINQIDVSDSE